ncbi:hypothetical protein FFT09_22580 [Saccharomonospora piscinae]|uniref:hypothetical protein n=1 Tax=Saccharomonospora piscinae TaxID=687388 RepID=UPI001107255E|nr:hypothetical protein [Saccharomonospora piscinae]TLW89221.1 hypothetical protein FFT09_22580 [Saccharomonospora piscinae]
MTSAYLDDIAATRKALDQLKSAADLAGVGQWKEDPGPGRRLLASGHPLAWVDWQSYGEYVAMPAQLFHGNVDVMREIVDLCSDAVANHGGGDGCQASTELANDLVWRLRRVLAPPRNSHRFPQH